MAGASLIYLSRFSDWRLREIDAEAVDEYRTEKVREAEARERAIEAGRPQLHDGGRVMRPLTPHSINRTIDTLQWVLTAAMDYGLIEANPAQGKRRRLRQEARAPVFLDSAAQVEALISAAESLDRSPESRVADRLPMIGTLIFAGLRSGEMGALLRRDVDLSAGRILIRKSKTAAGSREVTVSPILSSLLKRKPGLYPCRSPQELVFATRTGRPRDKDNIRSRILLPAVVRADKLLKREGPTAAASWRLPAQAPPHLRLDPRRLRGGPRLGDVSAGAHKSRVHLEDLRPHDAPGGRRARAVAATCRECLGASHGLTMALVSPKTSGHRNWARWRASP
jgi:integrase